MLLIYDLQNVCNTTFFNFTFVRCFFYMDVYVRLAPTGVGYAYITQSSVLP
jgi:hypothetical protein